MTQPDSAPFNPEKPMKTILIMTAVLIASLAQAQEAAPMIYPAKGQSEQQQSKDRSECETWSRKQAAYEATQSAVATPAALPSSSPPPAAPPLNVPPPSGLPTLPQLPGFPQLPGLPQLPPDAAASAAALVQSIKQQQLQAQQADTRGQQRSTYQRALAACMEGRGYTVR